MQNNRKIIHVDMDAFYASVETLYNPGLRGKPIAIGGSPESRSVISTANYEARKYGVRSAMSSYKAVKLCPTLILIPPDFSKYKSESKAIHEIFGRFTDKIEPLSLDEAYLDITGSPHFFGSATLIAKEIRRIIYKERGLTASAGIAPNKFLAKVASDWNKPNGQFVIAPHQIASFVEKLPVGKIFGVGRVTQQKLYSLGIKTCADLQKSDLFTLSTHFGVRGKQLFELGKGIDNRTVENSRNRKSLSVENTFSSDLGTLHDCVDKLPDIFDEFSNRYKKIKESIHVKSLFIKIKFDDFKVTTVERCSNLGLTLDNFVPLLNEGYTRYNKPVRLLGLGVRLKDKNASSSPKNQLEFNF
jgi:DNA polymerase-4